MTRTATATEPSQSGMTAAPADPVDEASGKQDLAPDCLHSLRLVIGREPEAANDDERYLALATAVRDRQMDAWLSTEAHQRVMRCMRSALCLKICMNPGQMPL